MTWPDGAGPMLESHRVGRLATADLGGQPSCVPVCFFWDGTDIFIALDDKPKQVQDLRQLRRVRNVLENPRVSFLLDRYSDDWTQLCFLQVRGVADVLEHAPVGAVAGLRARYPQYQDMAIDRHPMIRIHPAHATLWPAPVSH